MEEKAPDRAGKFSFDEMDEIEESSDSESKDKSPKKSILYSKKSSINNSVTPLFFPRALN